MDENMMILGHFRQMSFISGRAEKMENCVFAVCRSLSSLAN